MTDPAFFAEVEFFTWRPVETFEHPDFTEVDFWNYEAPCVLLLTSEKQVREAIPYYDSVYDDETYECTVQFTGWRWANHGSCSCCWGETKDTILAWSPMPSVPDLSTFQS